MNKKVELEDDGPTKKDSVWIQIKKWSSAENYSPIIFTAHCCNSMWSLTESDDFKKIANTAQEMEEFNGPDLMIIHGPVNPKKMTIILDAYDKMTGKKYVLGVGSCLSGKESTYSNQVENIEDKIPFDLIVPGCAIGAEAIINAIRQLKEIR